MRKNIALLVFFAALIIAGGIGDKAFREDMPLSAYILDLALCLLIGLGAFFFGPLYENNNDSEGS